MKYSDYREIPREQVQVYADKHELNIQSEDNYAMAAKALFKEMNRPKKGLKKTVSFKIDPDIIDGLDRAQGWGHKTEIVETGIRAELVKRGLLTQKQ